MKKSFKGYDDFSAVCQAAKYAVAAEHGLRWHLVPGASVMARLPAAWTACKVFGRVSKSPRDVRLPAAQFWPNGQLPVGPEYAAEYTWETDASLAAAKARAATIEAEHRAAVQARLALEASSWREAA